MNIICLYYFFFSLSWSLRLSLSLAMAPFQQASDLQIYPSGCLSCMSNNTGQTKCISVFPTTLYSSGPPPHSVGGPHAGSPRLRDRVVSLRSLSFLIRSGTKRCSVDFANIPGIPVFIASPLQLPKQPPSPPPDGRSSPPVHPPSAPFPSELPSHCRWSVPGNVRLGQRHLPGESLE